MIAFRAKLTKLAIFLLEKVNFSPHNAFLYSKQTEHSMDIPPIEEVIDIVREAGDIALKYYKHDPEVITKDDKTPVTKADREIDLLFRERFKVYGYPVLSEEFGDSRGDSDTFWVIDPIDGTKCERHR